MQQIIHDVALTDREQFVQATLERFRASPFVVHAPLASWYQAASKLSVISELVKEFLEKALTDSKNIPAVAATSRDIELRGLLTMLLQPDRLKVWPRAMNTIWDATKTTRPAASTGFLGKQTQLDLFKSILLGAASDEFLSRVSKPFLFALFSDKKNKKRKASKTLFCCCVC